jgi:hypothetical protein
LFDRPIGKNARYSKLRIDRSAVGGASAISSEEKGVSISDRFEIHESVVILRRDFVSEIVCTGAR